MKTIDEETFDSEPVILILSPSSRNTRPLQNRRRDALADPSKSPANTLNAANKTISLPFPLPPFPLLPFPLLPFPPLSPYVALAPNILPIAEGEVQASRPVRISPAAVFPTRFRFRFRFRLCFHESSCPPCRKKMSIVVVLLDKAIAAASEARVSIIFFVQSRSRPSVWSVAFFPFLIPHFRSFRRRSSSAAR